MGHRLDSLFQAIEKDEMVLAPDGTKCIVIKFKNGRAKIRALKDNNIVEAWVALDSLRTNK